MPATLLQRREDPVSKYIRIEERRLSVFVVITKLALQSVQRHECCRSGGKIESLLHNHNDSKQRCLELVGCNRRTLRWWSLLL